MHNATPSHIGLDQLMNSQQKRQELRDNLAHKEAPHFEMNTEEEGDGLPFPVNADSSESDVQSHKFNRESSMKDDEESKGLPVGAPMIDSESASRSASAAPSHKDQSSSKGAHESSSGLVIDEDDP